MAFESIEDTVKNFTRMSMADFEYVASVISSKVAKRDTYETSYYCQGKIGDYFKISSYWRFIYKSSQSEQLATRHL
jgi:hypothetical protein